MYFLNYDDPTKTNIATQFGYTATASKPNKNGSAEDWDPLGKAKHYGLKNQKQLFAFQKRHTKNPSGVWDEEFDAKYNQHVDSLKQYAEVKPVQVGSNQSSNQSDTPSLLDISKMPLFKQEKPVYLTVDGKTYLTVMPRINLDFQQGRQSLAKKFNESIGQSVVTEDDFVNFGQYRYAYDYESGCFRRISPDGTTWAWDSRWLPAKGFEIVSKNTVDYPEKEHYQTAVKRMGAPDEFDGIPGTGPEDVDFSDPKQTMFLMDKQGGTLVQHRKQGGRLINKHFIGGPMNTYNEPEKINKRIAYLPDAHVIVPDNTRVVNLYKQYPDRLIDKRPVVQMSPADQAREAARIKDEANRLRQKAAGQRRPVVPVKPLVEPVDNTYVAPKADVIDFQQRRKYLTDFNREGGVLNAFQQGGQMAPATAGPSGAQDIKMQVMQLVQAAMSGDQQATQQINQIMQAAQQGDAQAAQIAQLINQVAQELQGQAAPAARMGAKLNYIRSLKYARGGKACGSKVKANKCGGKAKKR